MPRLSPGNGGAGGRKRYSATVEKGENAWRREWSSFISGVDMKRVRDGTTTVSLRAKGDLAPRGDATGPPSSRRGGGEPSFSAAPSSFSYLFSSPAEKRAERTQKRRREEAAKKQQQREKTVSKHQQAIAAAASRGLKLEGMSRREVRDFLHLSRSKEQEAAQQRARDLKLYELMDDRLAWYQQGPHPIDLIAERLVARKAAKKGKRLGLQRYNYLLPHPSWMAVRARKRREGVLVGLGKRFVFDDVTGQAMDPLRNTPVDLTKVSLLLNGGGLVGSPSSRGGIADDAKATATDAGADAKYNDDDGDAAAWADTGLADSVGEDDEEGMGSGATARKSRSSALVATAKQSAEENSINAAARTESRMSDSQLLIDPTRALTTFARAIVRNREAALAIQRANLTTNFLSSNLVKGPSIGNDVEDNGGNVNYDDGNRHSRHGASHSSNAVMASAGTRASKSDKGSRTHRAPASESLEKVMAKKRPRMEVQSSAMGEEMAPGKKPLSRDAANTASRGRTRTDRRGVKSSTQETRPGAKPS